MAYFSFVVQRQDAKAPRRQEDENKTMLRCSMLLDSDQ
jgi:hypothetical protein